MLKTSLATDYTYKAMKYNFILVGGICVILIAFLVSNPKSLEQARIVSAEKSSAEFKAKSFLESQSVSNIEIKSVSRRADGDYEVEGKGLQKNAFKYATKYVEQQLQGKDAITSTWNALGASDLHEVKYRLLVNLQTGNVEILE